MFWLKKMELGELVQYQLRQLNIILICCLICFASCKPTMKAFDNKGNKIKLIPITKKRK